MKGMLPTPFRSSHWDLYRQDCRLDELESFEPKLALLLKQYGMAFDDESWYRLTKRNWVRRYPLWMKQTWTEQEKYRKSVDPRQKKLLEA